MRDVGTKPDAVNWCDRQGAPRKGQALLQGIVFCGRCGARMTVNSYATKDKRVPSYGCYHEYQQHGGATCQTMTSRGVDAAITELFLDAVRPAQVDIALQALSELDARRDATARQWKVDLQQAEYEVQLARRRYQAADPDNRLVAGELEARWEQALRHQEELQRNYQQFVNQQDTPLSNRDQQWVKKLSGDLARVWRADTTSMEDRKTLLRFLIRRVHLDGVAETGKIRLDVEWHTGAHSSLVIDRPEVGVWAPKTSAEVEQRIQELLPDHVQSSIADLLNQEGFQSAKGLPFNQYTVGYIVRTRGWGRQGKASTAKPR